MLAEKGRQRNLIERGGGWDLSESRMNERYQRRGSILPQSEWAKAIRMTKPSDNTGESADAKNNNNNKKKRKGKAQLFDSPEIPDWRSLGSGRTCQLFINPAFYSLLNLYSRLLPLVLPTQPRRPSCYLILCFSTCKTPWHKQQATARPGLPVTAPSAVVMQRPKRGIAQNERPTSSR